MSSEQKNGITSPCGRVVIPEQELQEAMDRIAGPEAVGSQDPAVIRRAKDLLKVLPDRR